MTSFLTLTGGNGSGGNGGAVLVDSGGQWNATGVNLIGNQSTGNGGAVENDGTTNLSGGNVNGNTAAGSGGAVDSSGNGQGQLSVTGSSMSGNSAASGGAIATNDPTTLTSDTLGGPSQSQANTASGNGGAVYAVASSSSAPQLTVSYCTLDDNQAGSSGSGGAIYTTMTTDVENSNLNSNSAGLGGGAIASVGAASEASGSATLQGTPATNSPLAVNAAPMADPSKDLTINNTSFTSNTANGGNGGAINTSNTATLNGNGFTGNTATAAGGNGGSGGAIYSDSGAQGQLQDTGSQYNNNVATTGNGGAIDTANSATLTDDNFTLNLAGTDGGAVAGENGATMKIAGGRFDTNSAGATGGAVKNTGQLQVTLDPNFFGALFTNNSAGTDGGAIESDAGGSGGSLKVNSAAFVNNKVKNGMGGAIGSSDPTDVEFSSFGGNQANFGGAIAYVITNVNDPQFSSSLIVGQDFFQKNSPPSKGAGNGGAIYCSITLDSGATNVTIANSTFTNNGVLNLTTVDNGGGVDLEQDTSGSGSATSSLTNDTFVANVAGVSGGGSAMLLNNTGSGQNNASLTSLSVTANSAGADAGGVFISGPPAGVVFVTNCILSGNTVSAAGYTGPVDVTLSGNPTFNDQGYNLVGTTDNMFNTGVGTNNPAKTNTPGLAAQLATNNAVAGNPETLALANTSPGYRKGNPNLAGQIDERGRVRQAGKVSIGAEDPDAQ